MARKNAILDEWRDEIESIYAQGYGIKYILKHLRATKPGFTGTGNNGVACALKRWEVPARDNQSAKVISPAQWAVKGGEAPLVTIKRMRAAAKARNETIDAMRRKKLKPSCIQAKINEAPLFSRKPWHSREYRGKSVENARFTYRYRNDASFKAFQLQRRRFNKWRNIWAGKSCEWGPGSRQAKALLGCDPDRARQWIESQFTDGMCWDLIGMGKGKLSIDHVVPCSWFDHSNIRHAALCWNYQNLRPMWHLDNVRRSASGDGIEDHFATVPWSPVVQMLLDFAATRSMVAVA